jgi:hypothetical protein
MKIDMLAHAALATAAALLAGCGSDADLLALKIELRALKQELEFVREQTEDLAPRVESTERMALQAFDERDAPAGLDCMQEPDRVRRAPVPALAAVCESTVAYTGGQRIRLRIGNPMAARLDRLALTVYAGDGAARGRSAKRLYRELALALAPGEWQSVDIDFDGIDAHDLRELAVRASVGHAALAPR